MNKLRLLLSTFFFYALLSFVHASSIEITNDLNSLNPTSTIETKEVRLYAQAKNTGTDDVYGFIQFFSNNKPIGDPQPVSILKGETDSVFIDVELAPGNHTITAAAVDEKTDKPIGDSEKLTQISVDRDFDGDLIGNSADPDDDNDGLSDIDEEKYGSSPFSRDTDKDGIGDPDEIKYGLDPTNGNDINYDFDNDGQTNIQEIKLGSDINKSDTDGDGIDDGEEVTNGTNPLVADTDSDGVNDKEDSFPKDNAETIDSDKDGVGNNKDTDDDNDGLDDSREIMIKTDPIKADTDSDGKTDFEEIEAGTNPIDLISATDTPQNLSSPQQGIEREDNHVTIWPLFIILGLVGFAIGFKLKRKPHVKEEIPSLQMKIEKNKPR